MSKASNVRGAGRRDVRRVLACGTFDLLHPGHESFLRQAAQLGDELWVVVARDENVLRLKGRAPAQTELHRLEAVLGVDVVDHAQLGLPGADFLRVVEQIAPSVVALGYDQRSPRGLAEAFVDTCIVTLEAYEPQRYKSSILRQARS